MEKVMAKEVVAVFTFRTKEEIISSRGSEAHALNPQNAQRCRYLVCTRNRYAHPADSGPEEHGAAFLVGKISLVEPSPERPDRYIIRFNEYALLDPQLMVREELEPVLGDQVVPLVSHAALALDVQTGLQRDDVAGEDGVGAVRDEVRRLGVTEAQAVP